MSETPKWAVEAAKDVVERTGTCPSYKDSVAAIIAKHSPEDALTQALEDASDAFRALSEGRDIKAINLGVWKHWDEIISAAKGAK